MQTCNYSDGIFKKKIVFLQIMYREIMNFCQTSLVTSRKTIGNDDWNRISNGLNPILQKIHIPLA